MHCLSFEKGAHWEQIHFSNFLGIIQGAIPRIPHN